MQIDSNINGRWVTEEEDSDVEIIIEFTAGVPKVSARCISDGEEMEIVDLRCEGDILSFDTIVPSSGYRARNRMRFLTADTCDFELTTWEKWKRKWI